LLILLFSGPSRRREEIRRQRIESEQRRRDELREGYRRLKDSLPVSNQKSSKVSLLDRGTFVDSLIILLFFYLSVICSYNTHQVP
jgi:hypothetical protein